MRWIRRSISKVPKRLRDCEAPRRARALASARNRGPTEYDRASDLQSPAFGYHRSRPLVCARWCLQGGWPEGCPMLKETCCRLYMIWQLEERVLCAYYAGPPSKLSMYKLNFGSPRSRPDASRTPETVCGHDHMTNVGSGRLQLHAPDPGPRRLRSFAVNRDVPAYKRPATPNAPLVLKPPPSPAPLSLACSAAARLPLRFKARTLGPRKVRPTYSVAGESTHTCTRMIYA